MPEKCLKSQMLLWERPQDPLVRLEDDSVSAEVSREGELENQEKIT